jgi:aminobenzoyl-glutamate utilization protein B
MYANMDEIGPPKFDEADFAFAREFTSRMTKEDQAKVMSTYFTPDYVLDMDLCNRIVRTDDRDKVLSGSVDGGDVSYIAPFAQFTAATWPIGSAAHTWTSVASSGSAIGRKAMIFAGKVMAATVYDLLKDPARVKSAREEFEKSLGGFRYVSPFDE